MSDVVFLAEVIDPANSSVVYGRGHAASITDENQVRAWLALGKLAYKGQPPPRKIRATPGTTTAAIAYEVDGLVTSSRVEWGLDTSYGTNTNGSPLTGNGTVTVNLSGLTRTTTYHYRVQVVTPGGTTYSPDLTFRTN